jgi:hypothetical protein
VNSADDTAAYFDAYPYADLYKAMDGVDPVEIKGGPPCKFRRAVLFPLRRMPLHGRLMNVPHNASAYLAQIYGPNWLPTPPKEQQRLHGALQLSCLVEWQ